MAKVKWIQNLNLKKGALHAQMGVPQGQKIAPEALEEAAEKGGTLGKRARLAETFRGMNHKKSNAFGKVKVGGR